MTVAGRIGAKRVHGGSAFLDVHDATGKIQALFREDVLGGDRYALLDALDLGDIIAVEGNAEKTRAGEDTVSAASWTLLTKSLVPLPDAWSGLQNVELRARQRELDLLVNPDARATLLTRSTIVRALRDFLHGKKFVEVETPILQATPGGASARPFTTHHEALDMDLALRIAPELYLKRLVVGGLERVFEIGRNFRNEGVDRQHNPEFTMCELYLAYATIEDLLPLTEELFASLLLSASGSLRIRYQGRELNFTPPWKRVSFVPALRDATGLDVMQEDDPGVYVAYLERQGITPPDARTLPALIETLYKEVVRKNVWDPVVLYDAPVMLSPLAKRREDVPALAQRMQLLAAGMELVNAYTELNDPTEQEERLREQEHYRARGDKEAQRLDPAYVHALRVGLPPTAGWGLGLDRLTMLLADRPHIRDVIAFPLFRPETPQS